MAVETQTHIQKLITMLVRSMGAKNAKILDLIKNAPAGAEELVLRVIAILTEKGKTAPPLVALIKEMATERELSPRYMVAVVADLDKVVYTHLNSPCYLIRFYLARTCQDAAENSIPRDIITCRQSISQIGDRECSGATARFRDCFDQFTSQSPIRTTHSSGIPDIAAQ